MVRAPLHQANMNREQLHKGLGKNPNNPLAAFLTTLQCTGLSISYTI